MTAQLPATPVFEFRDRDCNDGGGRRGAVTLLEAVYSKLDNGSWGYLDSDDFDEIGRALGHKLVGVSAKEELRQCARRGTVVIQICYDHRWLVWITADGLEMIMKENN